MSASGGRLAESAQDVGVQEVSEHDERERLRRLADTIDRNRGRFRDHLHRQGRSEEEIERELDDADRRVRELNERADQ